jgi:UbiD family decarboxylase
MPPPSFPDLRAFLARLRQDGDLVEVTAPVSARLEVAEIHRRVIAAGGPALLFTQVEGADVPLVTNLFGTARRAQLAFGERPFELIRSWWHWRRSRCRPSRAGSGRSGGCWATCCASA